MKFNNKRYIKCFTKVKRNELQEAGYKYLYENNGVFYFEDNHNLTTTFSDGSLLKNTKYSSYIPI